MPGSVGAVTRYRCSRCKRLFDDRSDAESHAEDHGPFEAKIRVIDIEPEPGELATLEDFTAEDSPDLSALSEQERRAVEAVKLGEASVRQYMRARGYCSPGTVDSYFRRARRKLPRRRHRRSVG